MLNGKEFFEYVEEKLGQEYTVKYDSVKLVIIIVISF